MTQKKIAPYGSWKSPITSELIVAESVGLGQVKTEGKDIYWIEMRPSEGGRQVIVRRGTDGNVDLVPREFNARTRVHEYGGGDYVMRAGVAYAPNFSDQRLYRYSAGAAAPITADAGEARLRYADAVVDAGRARLICAREDHTQAGHEAVNTIAAVSLDEGDEQVLISGNDFYSNPRVSPDGARLAWMTWNHPNMPWDGCELWVGDIAGDGSIANPRCVAGGAKESIFQPEWSPEGRLYFVSDRTGWWNIYRLRDDGSAELLVEMAAEFGEPQWVFGMSTYAFESAERIVATYAEQGIWKLALIDVTTGALEKIDTPYTDISSVRALPGRALFRAGSPKESVAIVEFDLDTRESKILRRASNLRIDDGYLSEPRAIEFPTENGLSAHAFFYPPGNADFAAPKDERFPLLVKSHGGPTSASPAALAAGILYWTSRGIGVLDVNYGGSTGYGRAYRERLNDNWGIVDVDDCANGARFLVAGGEADPKRLMIDGGSAGGYTTLCALTFRDTFSAGASHYGVSDAEALAKETHKFESRYLDGLIGPYPERRDLYLQRSPINFTDQLSCPVIFFQGMEDKVVPPSQAELMVDALRKKGLPVAYVAFEGEQHGFRKAENIRHSLDDELYFYSRVFKFELAEPIAPVKIENL